MRSIGRGFASSSAALLALFIVTNPAAATTTFSVLLDGSQEVGAAGDPTGSASGTLTLDAVSDTISWNIDYTGLSDPLPENPIELSGWHIHGPGGSPGSNAGVLVNLGDVGAGPIPNGSLIGDDLAVSSDIIDSILADPGDFYLNLHTSDGIGGGFPGGAIRGQVPEPNSFVLMGLGLTAIALRRR